MNNQAAETPKVSAYISLHDGDFIRLNDVTSYEHGEIWLRFIDHSSLVLVKVDNIKMYRINGLDLNNLHDEEAAA